MSKHDGNGVSHWICLKQAKSSDAGSSGGTGALWVPDPNSGGKIAFRMMGTLTSDEMTEADKKWLWGIAADADGKNGGCQACGTRGKYCHCSEGASRMDKKGRTIMSVFYLEEAAGKIAIYGVGAHYDAKGAGKTKSYSVNWDNGSKTKFTLGNSTDNK